jgi:hypothetical protein
MYSESEYWYQNKLDELFTGTGLKTIDIASVS